MTTGEKIRNASTVTPRQDGQFAVRAGSVGAVLTRDELRTLWIAAGNALLPDCDHCADFAETPPGESCPGCSREWTWAALVEMVSK